jgi:hypothetical protein
MILYHLGSLCQEVLPFRFGNCEIGFTAEGKENTEVGAMLRGESL